MKRITLSTLLILSLTVTLRAQSEFDPQLVELLGTAERASTDAPAPTAPR